MRGCADPRQSQYDGVCQLYVVENTERFQRARRAGLQCVWKGRGPERLQYGVRGCCFGGLCAAAIGTDTSFFVAGCIGLLRQWLQQGMPLAPDEMAAVVEGIITKVVLALQ